MHTEVQSTRIQFQVKIIADANDFCILHDQLDRIRALSQQHGTNIEHIEDIISEILSARNAI